MTQPDPEEPDMYADEPTIASDPIYVGPPIDLEVDADIVRVWHDSDGWIDDQWTHDEGEVTFGEGVGGTVRVVEMVPVRERDAHGGFSGYEESGDE